MLYIPTNIHMTGYETSSLQHPWMKQYCSFVSQPTGQEDKTKLMINWKAENLICIEQESYQQLLLKNSSTHRLMGHHGG